MLLLGKGNPLGFDDSNIHAKNTLCMVPTPFPDGSDARGGFAFDLFTNLAKQAVVSHEERAIWFVEYTAEPYNTTSKSYSASYLNGSSYSEHAWVVPALYTISKTMCDLEALQKGRFSFFSDSSSVSIINRENGVDNYDSVVENAATYYTATLADTASIIVHDELPYRCHTFDEESPLGDATWCRYSPTDKTQKFKGIDYKSTPRCQNDASCTRLAVQADGSYIRLSDLASLRGDGNHVLPDESETVTSVVEGGVCHYEHWRCRQHHHLFVVHLLADLRHQLVERRLRAAVKHVGGGRLPAGVLHVLQHPLVLPIVNASMILATCF